jgi:hypothetical protein
MLGTGSFEAEMISDSDLSRNASPWTERQIYLRE